MLMPKAIAPSRSGSAASTPQPPRRLATALERISDGNFSNAKGVGGGVLEYKIDFGPGYRVYFGKDGESLVILLGGGTKKGQDRDIAAAHGRWKDYKKRRSQEK